MTWDLIGYLLCVISGFVFFVSRNWRWSLISLALLYPGGFLLLYSYWPFEQAAILLVGGWMGVAVLGATREEKPVESEERDAGVVFRVFLFAILFLVARSGAEGAGTWIPGITFEGAAAGILLVGLGMVRTGIVSEPLQIVISLLAVLAGFTWVYAFVEASSLMTALLAVAGLGLAVVGAYLASYSETLPVEDR